MILCSHFHAAFRKHRSKSFPALHFYDLKDVQEPEMRRQMTDHHFSSGGRRLWFLWEWERTAQPSHEESLSQTPPLLPWQNPSCSACLTPSISERAVAAQHSSHEPSPAHWGAVCWQGRREPRLSSSQNVNCRRPQWPPPGWQGRLVAPIWPTQFPSIAC